MKRAGVMFLATGLLVSSAGHSPGQVNPPPDGQQSVQSFADDRYLDPTFGIGGRVVTQQRTDGASDSAVQPDGKIVVATHGLNKHAGSLLIRLLPNGAFDPGFGGGGAVGTAEIHPPPPGQPYVPTPPALVRPGGALETVGKNVGQFDPPKVQSLVIQDDGKIVVAGTVRRQTDATNAVLPNPFNPANDDFYIARFLPTGVRDPAFGTEGVVVMDAEQYDQATSIALQNDGKIVVAGGTTGGPNPQVFVVLRFNPDGTPDPSFGPGTGGGLQGPAGIAFDVIIQPDGKIVAGGGSRATLGAGSGPSTPGDFLLARFNADGTPDDDGPNDATPGDFFGVNGKVSTDFRFSDYAFSLALHHSEGRAKLLAGGCGGSRQTCSAFLESKTAMGSQNSDSVIAMARYELADGALDSSFGSGGRVEAPGGAMSLAVGPSGEIVTSQRRVPFTGSRQSLFEVMRFHPDGSADPAFGTGGIVGTHFAPQSFQPTGPEFRPAEVNYTQSVAVQADGKIVAAGVSGHDTGGDLVLARYLTSPQITDSDLAISIADTPDPVAKGDRLEYRTVAQNLASGPALGVTLTQSLPAEFSLISVDSEGGSCVAESRRIDCSFGGMLGGAKASVTVGGTVTAEASPLKTMAAVSTASTDVNPANNSATAETLVGRPAGQWTITASAGLQRTAHTATQLPGGKVLVVGGGIAELYDPVSDTWSETASLHTPRLGHTATALTGGKVMVAGGATTTQQAVSSVEIYDPVSGAWTKAEPLKAPRYGHTATLLNNGKVLIAGGRGMPNSLESSELYTPGVLTADPLAPGLTRTGKSEPAGPLRHGRSFHTSTPLGDGRVLAVGGYRGPRYEIDDAADPDDSGGPYAGAEIYDPATEAWQKVSGNAVARWKHTATALKDGRVLIAGGNVTTGGAVPTTSSEIYNPSNNSWTGAGPLLTARLQQSAALLPDGKVLIAGGRGHEPAGQAIRTAEIFDPASGAWKVTDIMHFARYDFALVPITGTPQQCGDICGKILAIGGTGERLGPSGGEPQASAEYYTPPEPAGGAASGAAPAPAQGDDLTARPTTSQKDPAALPPASPPGLPATPAGAVANASPLTVSNPVPGGLLEPSAASSLMQSGAALAGTGLVPLQQSAAATAGVSQQESHEEGEYAKRYAMVMSATLLFTAVIWAILTGLFGAANVMACSCPPQVRPAWAGAVCRSDRRVSPLTGKGAKFLPSYGCLFRGKSETQVDIYRSGIAASVLD